MNTTFLIAGIPQPGRIAAQFATLQQLLRSPQREVQQSRDRLFLRDALVALDGHRVGASYREIASIIYGHNRANAAWASTSTAMKGRMRRALGRGEQYRDGAYREFLE